MLRLPRVCCVLLLLASAAIAPGQGPPVTAPATAPKGAATTRPAEAVDDRVANFLKIIDGPDDAQSAAAEKLLARLGPAAMPALRLAAKRGESEKVRDAAGRVLEKLQMQVQAQAPQLREAAKASIYAGDYPSAIASLEPLASVSRPDVQDCALVGHLYGLAGNWPAALTAYRRTVEAIDGPHLPKPGRAGRMMSTVSLDGMSPSTLTGQRAGLLLLMGRVQRDLLHDPKTAAQSFQACVETGRLTRMSLADLEARRVGPQIDEPMSQFSLDNFPLAALEELVETYRQLGRQPAAVEACVRQIAVTTARSQNSIVSIDRLGWLMAGLEANAPPPQVGWLTVLTPDHPSFRIDLSNSADRDKAYVPGTSGEGAYPTFAIVPLPGFAFESLKFRLDLEQLEVRYGGQMEVSGATLESAPRWQALLNFYRPPKPPGREMFEQELPIPPGLGARDRPRLGHWNGKFEVHALDVTAQFRPRKPGETLPADVPTTAIQNEVLPPKGRLTFNGKPWPEQSAMTEIKPGPYTVTYDVDGNPHHYEATLDLKGDRRYGLFINLDSPFVLRSTNLDADPVPFLGSNASIARLRDGRYLAAFSYGGHVRLAISKDLIAWDKPYELPIDEVFDNAEPALTVDRQGKAWLMYGSNRMNAISYPDKHTWFITSSDDGQAWHRPRPVDINGQIETQAITAPQLMSDPDGRCRIYWRQFGAAADSFDHITRLDKLLADMGNEVPGHTQVYAEDANHWHMVYDLRDKDIEYRNSTDGLKWSPAVRLVLAGDGEPQLRSPQIVIKHSRYFLIYHRHDGSWLYRGKLKDLPTLEPPMKITSHVSEEAASNLVINGDRVRMLVLIGTTASLLDAPLADLVESK